MAALGRFLQKIFGNAADISQFGQIGSEVAGSIVRTKNIDTIQALSEYLGGLFSLTDDSAQPPAIEDINALYYLITHQLAYLFQSGVPEWLSTESYYANKSIVLGSDGSMYRSLTGSDSTPNVNHNPVGDSTNWAIIWDKTNDGTGSGLDADLLRSVTPGTWALAYLALATQNGWASKMLVDLKTVDGVDSGLDADLVRGTTINADWLTRLQSAPPSGMITTTGVTSVVTTDGYWLKLGELLGNSSSVNKPFSILITAKYLNNAEGAHRPAYFVLSGVITDGITVSASSQIDIKGLATGDCGVDGLRVVAGSDVYKGAIWIKTKANWCGDWSVSGLAATSVFQQDFSTIASSPAGTGSDRPIDTGASYLYPDRRASFANVSSLTKLYDDIVTANDSTGTGILIGGLGSSVGVGATIGAAGAPVKHFSDTFTRLFNKLGNMTITCQNNSVAGSTMIEYQTPWESFYSTYSRYPDVLVLAYGMNDGNPLIYNAGQTYPGFITQLRNLCTEAKKQGSSIVILTTPHPHSTRNPWGMQGVTPIYPTSSSEIPSEANSVVTGDFCNNGLGDITVSYRHFRINQAMRLVAGEYGCALIDVEKYWFLALQKYGEDALFDPTEAVHPNTMGHQLSYWAAIDNFLTGLYDSALGSNAPTSMGMFGVNTLSPVATLDVVNRSSSDKVLSLKNSSGTEKVSVDNDGMITRPDKMTLSDSGGVDNGGTVVIQPAGTFSISNNYVGTHLLLIAADRSGVGHWSVVYAVTRGAAWDNTGAITLTKLSESGTSDNVLTVTATISAVTFTAGTYSTNVKWRWIGL